LPPLQDQKDSAPTVNRSDPAEEFTLLDENTALIEVRETNEHKLSRKPSR